MKKTSLLIAVIGSLFLSSTSHAQSASESKAKAYFFSAQDSFAAKDYVNALNYLQSAENLLGKSNARIEALRTKTLYHKGDIEAAKQALDQFYRYEPSSALIRDMTDYTKDIEAKYEANKARAAAARRAQAEKDRQARLAADKRAREQAAEAEEKRQKEALRDIERQKMRAYLIEYVASCDTANSCNTLYNQARTEQKQLQTTKKNYATDIEVWFKLYNETKAKSIAVHKKKCVLTPTDDCLYSYATMLREHMLYTRMQDRPLIAQAFEAAENRSCAESVDFNCVVDAAMVLFLEGCDRSYAPSCNSVLKDWKRINRRGIVVKGTEAEYRRKTCNLGEAIPCWLYAKTLFSSSGRVWTSEAIKYADKACSLGRQDSCDELALALWLGRYSMKKNRKLAKTYHEKACSFKENEQERRTCLKSDYWKKVAIWNL